MKKNLVLLLFVVILAVIPFMMSHTVKEGQEAFSGADDQAETLITQIHPDYTPWFKPLWEPPSGEIESLMFGVQAAIGAGLIGYCLGFYRGRRSPMAKGEL